MKRILQTFTAALVVLLGIMGFNAKAAEPVAFDFFEDFDDPTHYELGGTLPDGWVSTGTIPFNRDKGENYGVPAKSGSYVLATVSSFNSTRDEVAFTPMMKLAANKECKISFWVYAPGGTPAIVRNNQFVLRVYDAQSSDAQFVSIGESEKKAFSEWTQLSFTYTPTVDVEVSFGVNIATSMSSCGTVAIDDFEITGFKPGEAEPDPEPTEDPVITLEPDSENEAGALIPPHTESFDNENDNYEGTTNVPTGWFTTGSSPFVTANINELPAHTGTYYLIANESTTVRDERIYTPFFMLEAGTEYSISGWLYAAAGTADRTIRFTVGTQQDADFHNTLLRLDAYSNEGWVEQVMKFTPTVSGAYCFSLALSSTEVGTGMVAFDDFKLTAEGLVLKPVANFSYNHYYNFQTGQMLVYPEQQIQLKNFSENGTSYAWEFLEESGATISDATAFEPTISFTASGTYTLKLTVKNSAGEKSTFKEFNVEYVDGKKDGYAIKNYADDDIMINRPNIPTFTDGQNDFVSGPTNYYRQIAERVELPEGVKLTVSQIQTVLCELNYKLKDNNRDEQLNSKFEVILMGETDGKPDETKEFGRYTSTMVETFTSSGVGGNDWGRYVNIQFAEPVEVTGNFYVTYVYDDIFDLVIDDVNVGSSFAAMQIAKHNSKTTTMYVKPTAVPEGSEATVGNWCPVSDLDDTFTGFGISSIIWVNSNNVEDEVILEPDEENLVDAINPPYSESFDNENSNYDGSTYVPAGWFTTGTLPFVTSSWIDREAVTGEFYLLTTSSASPRDERLYTPFFNLEAGVEYVVSNYLFMAPGAKENTSLEITVGTQQDFDFHKNLRTLENHTTNDGWERVEVKFTPKVSGAYCFAYSLSSSTAYSGDVAIEDFLITAPGLNLKPQVSFGCNHIYNYGSSQIMVFKGQTIQLKNTTLYGETFAWSVTGDAENAVISDATAFEPTIEFKAEGTYTVKLTATNEIGERSSYKEFNVQYVDSNITDQTGVTTSAGDDAIYSRDKLPSFDTEREYITGPNRYYRQIAERYALPSDVEFTISNVSFVVTNIHYKPIGNTYETQHNCKFNIIVYGETDGKIDENKVFGNYETTMGELFGTNGIGTSWGDLKALQLPEPIKAKGTFYLVFKYDDNFDIVVEDEYAGSSYAGLQAVKHASQESTLLVKPTALPSNSTAKVGEWCKVDEVDLSLKGFGLWSCLWITSTTDGSGSVAVNTLGDIVFAVRTTDNGVHVSGTRAGETVTIYNLNGAVVASAKANGNSTFVATENLANGLYIVKAGNNTKKFVK